MARRGNKDLYASAYKTGGGSRVTPQVSVTTRNEKTQMKKLLQYAAVLTAVLALSATAFAGECCDKAVKNAKSGKACEACTKGCCKEAVGKASKAGETKACKACSPKEKK